jgi:hypothetical protein
MQMANGNSGGNLTSPQVQEAPRGLSAPIRSQPPSEAAKTNVAYLSKPDLSKPDLFRSETSSAPPAEPEPDIATMRSARTSFATEADVRAAQIAAAEARADAKIARLESKIDTFAAILSEKMDSVGGKVETTQEAVRNADRFNHETRLVLLVAILAAAAVLCVLLLTLALVGDAVFARGMHVRDVVQTVIKEQREQPPGRAPAQGAMQGAMQGAAQAPAQGAAQAPAPAPPAIQHVR